jgi:hypothetical protein
MPIEIAEYPDPMSEGSLRGRGRTSEPVLVESNVSRVLKHELERYCRNSINGRSFLIAGHRGAGKTTLVAKAFMDVLRKSDDGAVMLRPLFISLHGPSLFPKPTSKPASDERQTGKKTKRPQKNQKSDQSQAAARADENRNDEQDDDVEKKSDAPDRPKSEAQIALEQITLGLHRAVSREFASRFASRASDLAYLKRTPNRSLELLRASRSSQGPPTSMDSTTDDRLPTEADFLRLLSQIPEERELFEMAGQFENELYESPPSRRLREHWARMHALSGGVLFSSGYAPVGSSTETTPTRRPPVAMFPNSMEVNEQGTRELVALSGVLEAYRRISGDYKKTEEEKEANQELIEKISGFNIAASELAAPVVSLLTGGLAGTGLAIAGASPAATAFGGVASAIGSSLIFKLSKTRKTDRSQSREYKFVYDLSVSTLDRVLPILIERLRNAGLAPVFVVDELDKVRNLSSRIISMVHHLKKLVAENAFFCFLTNRSYFEEMLAQGSGRAYPVEYTYYTHRLFVVFAAEDFERYLRIRFADPPQAETTPLATSDVTLSREAVARKMLRWILRHRSQLHVVDLEREIASLRNDQNAVRMETDDIISGLRNLIDLTFQVGIELTLSEPQTEQVLTDRPEFRRLQHDAMYYISRRWLAGEEDVDVSPAGVEAFRQYLEDRTGREDEKESQEITESGAREHTRQIKRSIFTKDVEFLFDQVRILAEFLSEQSAIEPAGSTPQNPNAVDLRKERIRQWNERRKKRNLPDVEADVQDVLLVGERLAILKSVAGRPGVYRFQHAVAGGRSAVTRAAQQASPDGIVEAWPAQATFIEAFDRALDIVTHPKGETTAGRANPVNLDTLAARFKLIAPSPTWPVVRKAIDNLRDSARRGIQHPNYSDDVFFVDQFHTTLSRQAEQIGRAIALGAFVGRCGKDERLEDVIANGMDVIARAMGLGSKREDEVSGALDSVEVMIRLKYRLSLEKYFLTLAARPFSLDSFTTAVADAVQVVLSAPTVEFSDIVAQAWENAQVRLEQWVTSRSTIDPDITELQAAAGRVGPTELLEFDPAEMTLHQWTRALLGSRNARANNGPPPVWLSFFAWHVLGFRSAGLVNETTFAQWAGVNFPSPGTYPPEVQVPLDRTIRMIRERQLLFAMTSPSTLLMLRRLKSPLTAQWRPVDGIASLIISSDELADVARMRGGEPMALPLTPPTTAAFEMPVDLQTQFDRTQATVGNLIGGAFMIYVYTANSSPVTLSPSIVDPDSPRSVIDAGVRGGMLVPQGKS